jgi:glucokinase
MDLIADIGATNSRCGLLNDRGRLVKRMQFENHNFSSLDSLLHGFLSHGRTSDRPTRGALAIAAPILGEEVSMLNRDWQFKQTEIRRSLGVTKLLVVNDFAAVAWALPALGPRRKRKIGGGNAVTGAALGVIGPGSGLGVSGLLPTSDGWTALNGEGGHVTLAATTPLEASIIDTIRDQYGHCSAERLLSGPGLLKIYLALAQISGRESTLHNPEDVSALASRREPLARQAMGIFYSLLGTVAGNLAVTLGARGGIYIGGGIIPKLVEPFERSDFRARFVAKGRYRDYLEAIPTYLITEPTPAFIGLRKLLGFR